MLLTFLVTPQLMECLPSAMRDGEEIRVVPVMFSQGINEQQTYANYLGQFGLQDDINTQSIKRLQSYFDLLRKWLVRYGSGSVVDAMAEQYLDRMGQGERNRSRCARTYQVHAHVDM